ncbi:MAG: hypothetical protein QXH30_03825 [Candidatus Bilamarchaeaceae archaeon]
MANQHMAWGGALMLLLAQACLCISLIFFQLPGAQEALADSIKAGLPPKMVPMLISYYPELNAFTYESASEYCRYQQHSGAGMEAGGITDEYVCQLVEGGIVTDTAGLRLFLARKVVEQKVDEMSAVYGPPIAYCNGLAPFIGAGGAIFAVVGFALFFFGSRDVPECAFLFSLFSGISAFIIMIAMGIGFLAAPAIVLAKAGEIAGSGGLERDVLSVMSGDIKEAIEGIFVIPMLLFGALSLLFAFFAFIFYVMGMAPRERQRHPKAAFGQKGSAMPGRREEESKNE